MALSLTYALLITGIGMGLVFMAILALWGIMEAIVRLTPSRAETPDEELSAERSYVAIVPEREMQLRRAAALAVATALELSKPVLGASGHVQPNSTSSWQIAQRASQFSRSQVNNRRNRGNSR